MLSILDKNLDGILRNLVEPVVCAKVRVLTKRFGETEISSAKVPQLSILNLKKLSASGLPAYLKEGECSRPNFY